MTSILFICLGNTCRSPTAEAVFRSHVTKLGVADRFRWDSAGLGSWHVGNQPNPEAVRTAAGHGIDMNDLISRQIGADDFHAFDLIIGMDHDNMVGLEAIKPSGSGAETVMLVPYALGREEIVPDPYGFGPEVYENTFALINEAIPPLVERLLG